MYKDIYNKWLESESVNKTLKNELKNIKSEEEIEDRFYKDLEFGTAGLRGIVGAGTNRMNYLTVGKTALALSQVIEELGEDAKKKGVVIGRDIRHFSYEFSILTAKILAENNITVYLFPGIVPTPILGYSIRYLGTQAGIMITASHNPKDYNGFKLYWDKGSQILSDVADKIEEKSREIDILNYDFNSLKKINEYESIKFIDDKVKKSYFRETLKHSLTDDIDKDLNIVYTPLSGCGNKYVRHILDLRGFKNVHVVGEQENPDPDFTNVKNPNPEDINSFDRAIELSEEVNADLIIATDPDSDRVAVLENNEEILQITGNQMGFILGKFILDRLKDRGRHLENYGIVKTVVTGDLIKKIAKSYGVELVETLTGFKNICNVANIWEETGERGFIYGYEESIGYCIGNHIRDKDAIITTMIIAELAGYLKKKNLKIKDYIKEIYDEYGYFEEYLDSIYFEGKDGSSKMKEIMNKFRQEDDFSEIGQIYKKKDFIDDPESPQDLLKFYFDEETWFALRPSGTEPKLKIYAYAVSADEKSAKEKIKTIEKVVLSKIKK
ncbi:phospho-sugar mutase [Peptoniphilus sp. MSJ-1]|uniref:phosphoglucomutase (alpha-D-glucose-1,6-bisphosphate-dependent) n=1 Tax=Peptoniphilus ovalis TaxID=2841503 RepID=A0ABS6FH37_9FIRM|nr:phospho-sugar mutase [Peptoniphilus ovalis]MBU5669348.1 phospho-sugar mutase [Peptoniphilus ovalis]